MGHSDYKAEDVRMETEMGLKGWKKYFNSYTTRGRFNTVVGTYGLLFAGVAAHQLYTKWYRNNVGSNRDRERDGHLSRTEMVVLNSEGCVVAEEHGQTEVSTTANTLRLLTSRVNKVTKKWGDESSNDGVNVSPPPNISKGIVKNGAETSSTNVATRIKAHNAY